MNDFTACFLSGGTALSLSFALMHPLDTLKTQLQATSHSSSRQSGSITKGNYFKSGLVSSFGAFCQGGLRLATYEAAKSFLIKEVVLHRYKSHQSNPDYTSLPMSTKIGISALSAISGDFVSSIVKVPREVIVSRAQTSQSSTAAIVSDIYASQGLAGFYRGFMSTTARDWPFMVILFSVYETFKSQSPSSLTNGWIPIPVTRDVKSIDEKAHIHSHISLAYSTITGGISGALAGFFTTPFDVLKTRIMTSKSSHSMLTISRSIITSSRSPRDATRTFFAGALPRSVWWFVVCSMFFPIYESSKSCLSEEMSENATHIS